MSVSERHLHGRRAALAIAVVLLLAALVTFPGVATSSGSGADADLARVDGSTIGPVAVTAARNDNAASAGASPAHGPVTFSDGRATASSFLLDGRLVSRAEVTLSALDILDGAVTADTVHLVARTSADGSGITATVADSVVTNLAVNGTPVEPDRRGYDVPGVGTLTALTNLTDAGGSSATAQIVGLRLELSQPVDSLPAGTVIVVAEATARADQDTFVTLDGAPKPKPSPRPTATLTPTPKPSPRPTATITSSSTSTSGTSYYPSYAPASSASASSYTPPPAVPSVTLLARFPGAVFPVTGQCTYSDDWGAPRNIPSGHHEGNDIFAPYGSPIVAVQDGVISNVGTAGTAGNNLRLTNNSGDYFFYAHLSRFEPGLAIGRRVTAGQTVGYVGTTGDAQGTSPHLHFEIHPGGGAPIDPYPYLNAWRAAAQGQTDAATTTATSPAAAGGYDLDALAGLERDKKGAADPATAAALEQVAAGLAAIDRDLGAVGERSQPEPGGFGLVLIVLNSAGVVVIKKLQLGALLL